MTCAEQFLILSKRTFRERFSDYFDKLRLLQAIGVAALLGLLWWKSKIETEAQLRDQVTNTKCLSDLSELNFEASCVSNSQCSTFRSFL